MDYAMNKKAAAFYNRNKQRRSICFTLLTQVGEELQKLGRPDLTDTLTKIGIEIMSTALDDAIYHGTAEEPESKI